LEGMIETAGGRAEVARPALPPTLRLTILRRLSFLSDDTLQALRFASILGSSFAVTDLSVTMDRPVVELFGVLAEGIAGRVRGRGAAGAGGGADGAGRSRRRPPAGRAGREPDVGGPGGAVRGGLPGAARTRPRSCRRGGRPDLPRLRADGERAAAGRAHRAGARGRIAPVHRGRTVRGPG